MAELLTAAQMRAIERAAIESGAVTGLELMERAGAGVVEAVFEEWPELGAGERRALVLCGPGNNGGDGFVVARLLHERGWAVEVFFYGDAGKLPPDARANYQRWGELGAVAPFARAPKAGDIADLCVDALFGTGLARPLQGDVLAWAAACTEPGAGKTVAVDIPSGLCSDSGRVLGATNAADLTVTFHSMKLGHVLADGPSCCGRVVVKDIGLKGSDRPRGGVKRPPGGAVGRCPAVPPGEVVRLLSCPQVSFPGKAEGNHKFAHGHALVLSGPSGKGGAARLAARGALRVGAGLVTLGVPHEALAENAARLDAVMLAEIGEAGALGRLLEDGRLTALCLGPGLGLERARELVPVALAAGRASVLDADALSAYMKNPAKLFEMLHENVVLTPHGGEFARLFPDLAEKLTAPAVKGPAFSKVDAAREAAKRAGCVVLFKGPGTVIAAPDGRCSVNAAVYERAAPWLATAGAGDVLAGFITGLLARGFAPMQAAEAGAWLHVECARTFGPGLIAEDLPEQLPKVFSALGL